MAGALACGLRTAEAGRVLQPVPANKYMAMLAFWGAPARPAIEAIASSDQEPVGCGPADAS